MAYSKSLADRVRNHLLGFREVHEKRMFGGIAFLWNGNMLVAVWTNALVVRLGQEQAGAALLEPHVREFDLTGRVMKGWVIVEPAGICEEEQLKEWIARAIAFVNRLPAK